MKDVKEALDLVSPSFCLAKWTQVTIHLNTGRTQSCCHSPAHDVPLEELASNPSALHNTSRKMEERRELLAGRKPAECSYCWKAEAASPADLSERVIKSAALSTFSRLAEVLENPLDERFVPSAVELSLTDTCNFKCSYCQPELSTSWRAEMREHGPYPTSGKHNGLEGHRRPLPQEANPYAEAWEKWWPDLYPRLKVLRFTGGEPLLSPKLFGMLDWIENHPRPQMRLSVNTNLCPPDEVWEKFVAKLRRIFEKKAVKEVLIYTSADAWGAQAQYIRHGMDFELWRRRTRHLLSELPGVELLVNATYNALSVFSFGNLLEEILELKRAYGSGRAKLEAALLSFPEHQSVRILPRSELKRIEAHRDWVMNHRDPRSGFEDAEIMKMQNILNVATESIGEDERIRRLRADFYLFFSEHDRRRGTNFLAVFPELEDFWKSCREEAGTAPTPHP